MAGSSTGKGLKGKFGFLFDLTFIRKLKTSFRAEEVCHLPAYEKLSSYWKSEIVVQALPIYQEDSDIVIGIYHDPVKFIPNHMKRWLNRRELEGSPLPAGFYNVKFKVCFKFYN